MADRVGQAATRVSTSPTRTRAPARPDTWTAWEDLVESLLRPGARRARHLRRLGPPPAELAVRLAAVRRRRRRWHGLRPGLAERLASACCADAEHLRDPPHAGSATTARSSCTRCWSSGSRLGPTSDPARPVRARPAGRERRRPTSGPTACTASAPPTTTASCCARSSARSPTPAPAGHPRRRSAARPRGRAPVRLRPAHPASRRADPLPLRRRCRRLPARCWRPAAELLDRPDLLWAASGGGDGVRRRPSPDGDASRSAATSCSAAAGATTVRAYADERFMLMDCGPLGDGGHGHYDQLSVELDGPGPLAGRRPRAATPTPTTTRLATWFKGTAAHNTVTVDGLDQTPYRHGASRRTGRRSRAARGGPPNRASTMPSRPRSRSPQLRRPSTPGRVRLRRRRLLGGPRPVRGATASPLRGPLAPGLPTPRDT